MTNLLREYRHSVTGEIGPYTEQIAAIFPELIEVESDLGDAIYPGDPGPDAASADAEAIQDEHVDSPPSGAEVIDAPEPTTPQA